MVNQEDLAKFSGVGLRTMKQFESGKGNPKFEHSQSLTNENIFPKINNPENR